MSDKITIHARRLGKGERLRAALRSTDDHLFPHNGRILVTGPDDKGELVELGSFDPLVCLQRSGVSFHDAADRVRFTPEDPTHD